jgi:hypothetical protein
MPACCFICSEKIFLKKFVGLGQREEPASHLSPSNKKSAFFSEEIMRPQLRGRS